MRAFPQQQHFIKSAHESPAVLKVINPADGQVLEECRSSESSDVDAAVDTAQRAFLTWRNDETARREALRKCAKVLSGRRTVTRLATRLTQEQGKPFREALKEVYAVSHWFSSTAEMELKTDILHTEPAHIEVRRQPLGVVAAITPWNYPLFLAACKTAPALLTGNTVILKPSPFTPLATRELCQLLTHSSKPDQEPPLPEGVLQAIIGDDETGALLVRHPRVQKVSFTGSTRAGIEIARAASHDLKRLTLELGGNDAAIVLGDVDLEKVAEKLFWGAFTNTGQFCVGIKRLYVQQSLYEDLVDRLVAIAGAAKVGNGLESGVQLGPINNQMQFDRIVELVEDARNRGGRVQCGGKPTDGPGYFYPPTIVTDVSEGVRLVDEEQFGPALPVMPFSNVDEAIQRANSTKFGLGGSIWTTDPSQAAELALRLECGTSWINQHGELDPHTPFGGAKLSGIGYENGLWGLDAFTQLKVVSRASL